MCGDHAQYGWLEHWRGIGWVEATEARTEHEATIKPWPPMACIEEHTSKSNCYHQYIG